MLVAGGVAAVAACSGSITGNAGTPGTPSGDASDEGFGVGIPNGTCPGACNMVTDPCIADPPSCADAAPDDGSIDAYVDAPMDASVDAPNDGSVDAPVSTFDGNFCCNANPDPCCPYLHCGGPLTATCSEELACQADGGTWTFCPTGGVCVPVADGDPWSCPDAALSDAGPSDAADGPTGVPVTQPDGGDAEAAADAAPDVVYPPFCCNANPDPCCEYLYCGGSLTPDCSAEMACQADGGTYNPYGQYTLPDGSIVNAGCSLPSEAGPDGAPDSEPSDAGGG